ncbi:hypothetical protein UFOVP638_39 [uncultured Caudovirales phage]|uniref:Uncharacterized protein n=1 Tax=uncultured Caudovirales phage TaxID=2100421 RepID=A0A6J5N334_9CAUD|nr:hypothetical protein UFOVP638_39 [uncultured Caudovirales phage]
MKPFRKVYELTYKEKMFYVHKKILFFRITISKQFLKAYGNPEPAIKYMRSLK